jgi:hypothetical protein
VENGSPRGAPQRSVREVLELPAQALLTPTEAAAYLRSTPPSLAQRRALGNGPKYEKRGSFIRYRKGELDRWLEGRAADQPPKRAAIAVEAAA